MELPKKEGAYLFYFGDNEQFYDIDEVLLDDEGNPYLLSHYSTGTPTHWWNLPEPNKHFETDYEVGRNAGIQEGIERMQKAYQIRPRGKPIVSSCPECSLVEGKHKLDCSYGR